MKLPRWLHPFRRTTAAPRRESYAAMKARGLAELQRRYGDEWTDADTDRYYATFMVLRYLGLLVPEARMAELERTLRRVVGG